MTFTTLPVWTVEPVTAADLTAMVNAISELRPVWARKTSDETVNNSAVLQNDDQLVAAMVASATYRFHLRLIINSGTTPDFKFTFTLPAGATGSMELFEGSSPTSAATVLQGPFSVTTTVAMSGVGADQIIIAQGVIVVSTTAGNAQLQWAQNTATGSNTSVKTNSFLHLQRMT